jgi:hypothetical protein
LFKSATFSGAILAFLGIFNIPIDPVILKIVLLIPFLLICQAGIGQSKPGIYLTMDPEMGLCDHKMKMLKIQTVHCLSEEPLLEFDSFRRVNEMEYDSLFQMHKFSIILTKKASDYINTIAEKLPGHDLALVVNGILVTTIDLEGITNAGSIVIWDIHDSQSIVWIHRSLVKAVTKNSRKS